LNFKFINVFYLFTIEVTVMGSWILRWNFDRPNYAPGEVALVSFWFENLGDTPLYISDILLEFDFGVYSLGSTVSGIIQPRRNVYVGSARIQIPSNVVGRRLFTIRYYIYEYINGTWIDLNYYKHGWYFINIYPRPLYRVFISRGIRGEDRIIGDYIVEKVKEWGFETVTVGVEIIVPEEQVPMRVRDEIMRADALIAIATPRFLDALTGLWKTLEWLHGETGIAYGVGKPLLILKDKRVHLGGLPGYLASLRQVPVIEFDPFNLEELGTKLSAIMPQFREWIENRRSQEFFEALAKLAVTGLALLGGLVVLSGIVGSISESSKR
jgi:hypothetical protein